MSVVTQLVTQPQRDAMLRELIYATLDPMPKLLIGCNDCVLIVVRAAHYFIQAMHVRHIDIFTSKGTFLSHTFIQTEITNHFCELVKNEQEPREPRKLYDDFFEFLGSNKLVLHQSR
jgi:hypothetical protein